MTTLLPLALLFELLALLTRLQALSVASGALLVLFFVWHWRSLMPYPQRLGLVTLMVLGYWLLSGMANWPQAARLLSSAAYYGAFIGALGLMHCLVRRLEQLSELHRILLAGPRAWLYPGYLMSTFAISSVLSFGMLNLICGSLENHLARRPYTDSQRREGRRGVMVTALRGFALVPLLAPTSVAVAILTRELPGLSWAALLPFGLLGVAPLISLNLCAALLAQLASQGLAVMQPAVALLFGFSLAMLLSPYGPSALLLARHAQLSPWRIAVGWNGRFVLSVLLPLLLIPLLA